MFEAFMACFPDPLSIASEVGSRQFVNPDSERNHDDKEGKLAPESVLEAGKSTKEDTDGTASQKYSGKLFLTEFLPSFVAVIL